MKLIDDWLMLLKYYYDKRIIFYYCKDENTLETNLTEAFKFKIDSFKPDRKIQNCIVSFLLFYLICLLSFKKILDLREILHHCLMWNCEPHW